MQTLRKESKPLNPLFAEARQRLVIEHPFWGCLALHLNPVECHTLPDGSALETAAVDGKNLFFNPDYLAALSILERVGLLAHEAMHCALLHFARRNGRDVSDWNIAADYALNWPLVQAGLKLPKGALVDSSYAKMNAEEIFRVRRLKKEQAQKQQQQQQQQPSADDSDETEQNESGNGSNEAEQDSEESKPSADGADGADGNESGESGNEGGNESGGNGADESDSSEGENGGQSDAEGGSGDNSSESDSASGQGNGNGNGKPRGGSIPGNFDSGMCGGVIDATEPQDSAERKELEADWSQHIRQALAVAKRQNAGTLPGYLEKIAADINEPQTDIRAIVRQFIDSGAHNDYSWTRPNRRMLGHGYILPGYVPDRPAHIVCLVDSSGSMDSEALAMLLGELQGALDDGAADKITVAYADTQIHAEYPPQEYQPGDTIPESDMPRGGTAFREPLQWVADNVPDASAILYLTDLETSDFGESPNCPILWLVTGYSPKRCRALAASVPFGEAVLITDC